MGKSPFHSGLLVIVVQWFYKFLQHLVATALTMWTNQRAEFKSCSLIEWHSSRSCNRMLQELGKPLQLTCIQQFSKIVIWLQEWEPHHPIKLQKDLSSALWLVHMVVAVATGCCKNLENCCMQVTTIISKSEWKWNLPTSFCNSKWKRKFAYEFLNSEWNGNFPINKFPMNFLLAPQILNS